MLLSANSVERRNPIQPADSGSYPAGSLPADPNLTVTWPRSLYSREDQEIEWWYYSGHLASHSQRFGFHLVFFRTALGGRRPWVPTSLFSPLAYYAHFSLTDVERGRFRYAHRRASRASAGAAQDRFGVWLDDWSVQETCCGHVLTASLDDAQLNLTLVPAKPPVIHRQDGLLIRQDDQYRCLLYYPRLQALGRLALGGTEHTVTGSAFMDREFGSWMIGTQVMGWDWLAVQLDDGRELIVRIFRDAQHRPTHHSNLILVERDGSEVVLRPQEFNCSARASWTSPITGIAYPSRWRLTVPRLDLELEVVPLLDCQELDTRGSTMLTYWEGAAAVHGQAARRAVSGRAYVELAGYGPSLQRPNVLDWMRGELSYRLAGNERVVDANEVSP